MATIYKKLINCIIYHFTVTNEIPFPTTTLIAVFILDITMYVL